MYCSSGAANDIEVGAISMNLYNLGNASSYSYQDLYSAYQDGDNAFQIGFYGGGVLPQASKVDGIWVGYNVSSVTGNITARLYGYKKQ